MAISLQKKFTGREAKIVQAVKDYDIDSVMVLYGVKHRNTFIRWLKENTSEQWKPNPLSGMAGGERELWLRTHRSTILDCLEIFGKDWTITHFCFSHDTLDRLIQSDHEPFRQKLTRMERLELDVKYLKEQMEEDRKWRDRAEIRLQMVDEQRREETRTVKTIEEAFYSFTKTTSKQLSQGISEPLEQLFQYLLERLIKPNKQLPPPLEKPDLTIDSAVTNLKKAQFQHKVIKSIPENPLLETITRINTNNRTNGNDNKMRP